MKTVIIKIGNSKGLLLSKTILDKQKIKDKVELLLEEGQIILKPIDIPRKNWEIAFEKMSKDGGDEMLINDVFTDKNFKEWSQYNI